MRRSRHHRHAPALVVAVLAALCAATAAAAAPARDRLSQEAGLRQQTPQRPRFSGARPPLDVPAETLTHVSLKLGKRSPSGVPGPIAGRPGAGDSVTLARGVAAAAAFAAGVAKNKTELVTALLRMAQVEAFRAGALSHAHAQAPNVSAGMATCAGPKRPTLDDDYPYPHVLRLALDFYHAQRSGHIPPNDTYAVPWRGPSVAGDPFPAHFDAGDHLLLLFPYGQTLSLLGWAFLPENFRAGFDTSPGAAASLRSTLRTGAEAIMAAHTAPLRFIVQVGEEHTDHDYWGRPEDMAAGGRGLPRPVLELDGARGRNGSEAAAEGVAALAAAALAWEDVDPVFAASATAAARSLFAFASRYEGYFSDGLPVGNMYPSTSYLDDLAWAAAWMLRLTGEGAFREAASTFWDRMVVEEPDALLVREQSWAHAAPAAAVMLAGLTDEPKYAAFAYLFVETHVQGAAPVAYTAAGLAYRNQWGSLRNAANPALVAAVFGEVLKKWAAAAASAAPTSAVAGAIAAKAAGTATATANATAMATAPRPATSSPTAGLARLYACWARGQARFALGDTGRSFVVGWGVNPPTHVHHRAASCGTETGGPGSNAPACGPADFASPGPNPQTHVGALAGGPDFNDVYNDTRSDYVGNEVALDYNAAFTGVLAMLSQETGETWNDCMTTFPADLRPILRVV